MIWTDNMQIPIGAPHAYTAEVFMNYVYDPRCRRRSPPYVNYVTPGQGREGDPRRRMTRSSPRTS